MSKAPSGKAEVLRLRQSIQTQMRRGILEAIALVLEEKLTEALGTGRYERGEARRGDHNGHQSRRITTAVGHAEAVIDRASRLDADSQASSDSACSTRRH